MKKLLTFFLLFSLNAFAQQAELIYDDSLVVGPNYVRDDLVRRVDTETKITMDTVKVSMAYSIHHSDGVDFMILYTALGYEVTTTTSYNFSIGWTPLISDVKYLDAYKNPLPKNYEVWRSHRTITQ